MPYDDTTGTEIQNIHTYGQEGMGGGRRRGCGGEGGGRREGEVGKWKGKERDEEERREWEEEQREERRGSTKVGTVEQGERVDGGKGRNEGGRERRKRKSRRKGKGGEGKGGNRGRGQGQNFTVTVIFCFQVMNKHRYSHTMYELLLSRLIHVSYVSTNIHFLFTGMKVILNLTIRSEVIWSQRRSNTVDLCSLGH